VDPITVARKIVDELFTNGDGQQAERLMMILPGGRDGGGWGRRPAQDKIERILRAALRGGKE
jgi:hypothetical protein